PTWLNGSTPTGADAAGAKNWSASANAVYGSECRRIAQEAGGATSRGRASLKITAEARVVASAAEYLGLATNVRSPGPACSSPATRTMSIAASPSRRQRKRSAISPNCTGTWGYQGLILPFSELVSW